MRFRSHVRQATETGEFPLHREGGPVYPSRPWPAVSRRDRGDLPVRAERRRSWGLWRVKHYGTPDAVRTERDTVRAEHDTVRPELVEGQSFFW